MTDPKQPELSELIFSNATNEIKRFAKESRRSALSISNRLQSIEQDAAFVKNIADHHHLPLIANERCGSWYIDPDDKTQSAYFKSTDGHAGQWSFSLRRLNLQVVATIIEYGGCIIVDSTRRGKSMPDALSKTIPIWIAVLNRYFFPDHPRAFEFHTPTTVLPPSEHSQIEARLAGFVEQLKSLDLDLDHIRARLTKPLLPLWVTPDLPLSTLPPPADFLLVILCTASRRVPGGEDSENGYIQGAADDSESWAHGLTPSLFWKHKTTLVETAEDDIPALISSLVSHTAGTSPTQCTLIKPTTQIHVGTTEAANEPNDFILSISCTAQAPAPAPSASDAKQQKRSIHLACAPGKVGSRQLRHALSALPPLLDALLKHPDYSPDCPTVDKDKPNPTPPPRILITCPTGRDHSIGVALTILCLYANDLGQLVPRGSTGRKMDKNYIKQRLSWIMVSVPDANPSRTTLQSVNAFLLG